MSEQLRAGHFLASLNGNLPGIREDYSHATLGATNVFSTHPRGVAGRPLSTNWDPSNLTMESVQWDKTTYVLPKVLPPTAAPELRSRVLALTLKTLKRSNRGDDATKAALLEQRFQCASAATRARTTAAPAKNILGGAYTFADPLIKRNSGAVINMNEPPTENDRRNGKFLEFRATFRAITLSPTLSATPQSFIAAIRLPRSADTDLIVDGLATRADCLNVATAMTEVLRVTAASPELLSLGEVQNGRLQIKEQEVLDKMTAIYDKVYFQLLQKEIEEDYVGEAIQNAQSIVQNTKQMRFVGGRPQCDPIEVYLKRFSSAVDLLDEETPYPIDIVSTCHQNMADITRKQIKTLGWVEPPRAASNAGQHAQLSRLRTIAIRAEEAINTTRLISGTRRSTAYANNAFMTNPVFAVNPLEGDQDNQTPQHPILPPLPEIEVQRPPGPPPDNTDMTIATGISTIAADRTALPNAQALMLQPVPTATLMEEAREFQIFISNSEIAMRTAAGEENKLCWGGCYKFFPNDSDGRHTYTSCPFRRVDRVREHALPFLKRFRQQNGPLNRKVSSLLSEPERLTAAFCQPTGEGSVSKRDIEDLQDNWSDRGFYSAEMARSICLMANPATSKRVRELESANMRSKIIRAAANRRRREQDKADLKSLRSQQTSVATATADTNHGGMRSEINEPFILVTLPIFSTGIDNEGEPLKKQGTVNVPSLLRMSQALPHIDIPIGTGKEDNLLLRTVFDSGAGLNVGRRGYHENIKNQYPGLVSRYIDLQKHNYDTPGIGGVDGNAYGSAVTALITYHTPFKIGGQPVLLTFGLVEGLCAKSILGITTMQKARMSYLVHAQVVTSEMFNHTFKVTMQKPTAEDLPPAPIAGNSAVLQAQAKSP